MCKVIMYKSQSFSSCITAQLTAEDLKRNSSPKNLNQFWKKHHKDEQIITLLFFWNELFLPTQKWTFWLLFQNNDFKFNLFLTQNYHIPKKKKVT